MMTRHASEGRIIFIEIRTIYQNTWPLQDPPEQSLETYAEKI